MMSAMSTKEATKGIAQDSKKEIVVKVGDLRKEYDVKEEVGRGKFGVVHKVINKKDGATYAAKFVKITQTKRKDVLHEVDIMKKLCHENLVNLTDVYDMDTRIVVIMEFISGGELFERIVEEDNLTESEAAIYMKQLLEGLQHMHEKNIVHLDLKPENIVCVQPQSTRIKLIDFGLAQQLTPGKETKITCGTPEFVAPEVLNYDPVTLASDMWSVGVIAYILLSGLSPFLGDTDGETFSNVSSCEWDFDDECFDEVSKESKDFIENLLIPNPRNRKTVGLCLEHDWIQNYNCKKNHKIKVDNLRKFLAKKRWQRSVNAVRAIRRLSSFGAALLGKPPSLLGSRKKLSSIDSPTQSISEEPDEKKPVSMTNETAKVEDTKTKSTNTKGTKIENAKAKIVKNESESINETITDQRVIVPVAVSCEKKRNRNAGCSEEKGTERDKSRGLANISELRQRFENLSETFRQSYSSSGSASGESISRDSSIDYGFTKVDTPSCSRKASDVNVRTSPTNDGQKKLSVRTKDLTHKEIVPEDRRDFKENDGKRSYSSSRINEETITQTPRTSLDSLKKSHTKTNGELLAEESEKSFKRQTSVDYLEDRIPERIEPVDKTNISDEKELSEDILVRGSELNRERRKATENSAYSYANSCATDRNQKHEVSKTRAANFVDASGKNSGESKGLRFSEPAAENCEDVSTKKGLHNYLQRMIKEGKLPGGHVFSEMPRHSWSKTSAAAKRASFKELLSQSIKDDDDDADSEDEEPVKIEIKKAKFDDFYECLEEIGRGRFGIVSKVKEKSTGKFFAAKFIKVRAATRDIVRQEIDILSSVRHRRIVKLYEAYEENRKFILVLEWVAGGELFAKLSQEETISEKEAVFFIKQMLHAVRCMHRKDILHLDLKPENVMLTGNDSTELKIIDFGLAKRYNPKEDIKVLSGTPAFAAPEVMCFEKISKATDMWSIGVIAYVLLSGASPFMGDDPQETISNVTKAVWDFDDEGFDGISADAKDFISKLMIKRPRDRMTVDESIEHPWVKNARKRRQSHIKTRSLFKFTKSFSQSVDFSDDVFIPPKNEEEATQKRRQTISNLQEIRESKENDLDIKPKIEVTHPSETDTHPSETDTHPSETDTHPSETDTHPSETETSFAEEKEKMQAEIRILEEQLKCKEKDYEGLKARLEQQSGFQKDIEQLQKELEKSLAAHQKVQESLLFHEKEREKLLEEGENFIKEINKQRERIQELLQKLDAVNDNYESLSRKYKRLQEKLERSEDLEDRVEELERINARKVNKIRELEELLSEASEVKRKSSRSDDAVRAKLEKENLSLQNTLESCHQEIEELEERLGTIERENTKLRKELKQWRGGGKVDNNNKNDNVSALKEKIKQLELVKTELEKEIEMEIRDRKLAENERDTIEEEFGEERSNLENRLRKEVDHNRQLDDEIREMTSLLEASKKSYFQLDEEYQDMKKGRKEEAAKYVEEIRAKEDVISHLKREKETLTADCDRMNKKMTESIQEIQKLENINLSSSRLSLSEGKGTIDRRTSAHRKEMDRVKEDLAMTQDHLRIATDTNSLLQLELQKLKKDHETELNIQLIEQEVKLNHTHEEELDRVREEMSTLPNNERKELEDRITVQDFAIRKLQALLELREREEGKKDNSEDIVPITVNGNDNSDFNENARAPKRFSSSAITKTSSSKIITVSAGKELRLSQSSQSSTSSQVEENGEEDDQEDTLTERELRRISYKIADGAWNTMGQALVLRGAKYEEIMGSSNNDQEKIYRLLSLWKTEMKQPRNVLISQLTVAIERMKRRDIVKFVKELNAKESSNISIRKRIRNFVR